MATRLIVNMTQVYLPMYVSDTVELEKVNLKNFILYFHKNFKFQKVIYSFNSICLLYQWLYKHVSTESIKQKHWIICN